MSDFHTATAETLQINLVNGISRELVQVNTRDDIKRWWEVMDRTAGTVVSTDDWDYDTAAGAVEILLTAEERSLFRGMVEPLYERYCADYMDLVEQIRQG